MESDYAATLGCTYSKAASPDIDTIRLHGEFLYEYNKLNESQRISNFASICKQLHLHAEISKGGTTEDRATYFRETFFKQLWKNKQVPKEIREPLEDLVPMDRNNKKYNYEPVI